MRKNEVYIPNEIFDDFRDNIKSSKHNAFAYSYYYYITYLYRECEWYKDQKITQSMIKEKLGMSPIEKRIDYLIKKDGILDTIGYTETTTDYPMSWRLEDNSLSFKTIGEHCKETGYTVSITDRGFKVKLPVKSFYRNSDSQDLDVLNGTFYSIKDTHGIEFKKFERIMADEALGYMAFYLYGYIKHKNGLFGTYDLPIASVKDELIMSTSTFQTYINKLESKGLMKINRGMFSQNSRGETNSYMAL